MCSLHSSDINLLSDIWSATVFSHSVGCRFIFFMTFLLCRSCLLCCSPIFKIFSLLPLLLVSSPRNHCQDYCQGAYSLYFSSRIFIISGLKFVFDAFWVDFCVCCIIWVQFHSFASDWAIFPKPFIEESILSQGKPKNTGVGNLSLLQGIFRTGLYCIAGEFFTNWAMREAYHIFLAHYKLTTYMSEIISGLSILFYWSLCLLLCQYHTVFIKMIL